jgi:hypothetical protein
MGINEVHVGAEPNRPTLMHRNTGRKKILAALTIWNRSVHQGGPDVVHQGHQLGPIAGRARCSISLSERLCSYTPGPWTVDASTRCGDASMARSIDPKKIGAHRTKRRTGTAGPSKTRIDWSDLRGSALRLAPRWIPGDRCTPPPGASHRPLFFIVGESFPPCYWL